MTVEPIGPGAGSPDANGAASAPHQTLTRRRATKGGTNGAGAPVVPIRPDVDPQRVVFARGDHVEIAARVLDRLGPDPVTYDVGRAWRYSPARGVWEALDEELLEDIAGSFAGAPCTFGDGEPLRIGASAVKGARHILRNRLLADPARLTFSAAPAGMAFVNGFVTVAGGVVALAAHSPTRLARWRYEFTYDASAPCPRFLGFLGELFADVSGEEREGRIALLQEFLGACLVGDATRYQRYLVMFAPGGNGKSELLRVCRACFPPGTVTSLEPQKWSDDRHAAALEGVRANFVDELPDDEIMGGHNVKRIVTGEPLTARRVYKDAITFSPKCGHIFATNVPIQSSDYSDGFWERPAVLLLSRKFRASPHRRLEAAKGIVEEELAGIVAWAIEGAARAQRLRGYSEPASSAATLLEWRDDNDQVRGFVGEKPLGGSWEAATLYDAYREWAKASGCAVMSLAKFGRRLVANGLAERWRTATKRGYAPMGWGEEQARMGAGGAAAERSAISGEA